MFTSSYYDNSYFISIHMRSVQKYIFNLQKDIYLSTRKYDISGIYKYQRELISKKELLILVTFNIIGRIKKSFSQDYFQKFLTYIYFSILKKIKLSTYILKYVKSELAKHVIFILLKPEWLAKIERCLILQQKKDYIKTITNHISQIINKHKKNNKLCQVQIQYYLVCKNINYSKLIKKVDSHSIILKKLYSYLVRQDFFFNDDLSTFCTDRFTFKDKLSYLLEMIFFTGLEWFIYSNIKRRYFYLETYLINQAEKIFLFSNILTINYLIKYLSIFTQNKSKNLKSLKINIYIIFFRHIIFNDIKIILNNKLRNKVKPSKKAFEYIFYTIRCKLYHKNNKSFWRSNNQLRIHEVLLFINHLLQSWLSYYLNILNKIEIKNLNKQLDGLIYLWQRKKYK